MFDLTNFLCSVGLHSLSRWEIIGEGEVMKGNYKYENVEDKEIGTWVTQQRACDICNKVEQRTIQNDIRQK
jgi:hypothetical protein